MLLSNMTKHEGPAVALLKTDNALEELADVFVKGVDKMYNKQANYDFLASVFANLSMVGPSSTLTHSSPLHGSTS